MTPNDIWHKIQVSAFLTPHQSNFFLQYMVVVTETHKWTMWKKWETLEDSVLNKHVFIYPPYSPCSEKRMWMIEEQEAMDDSKKTVFQNKTETHMTSHTQGPHKFKPDGAPA